MPEILALLKELLPLWAVVLLVGFGYLILLLKRASDRFLDLADKQADYLKDRIDVVDKSTGIFTRTIDQQEKEIADLTQKVASLRSDLQNARETDARLSVDELRILASHVERLSTVQQELQAKTASLSARIGGKEASLPGAPLLPAPIGAEIGKAIRARDLSVYSVLVAPLKGALGLVQALREAGYAASLYGSEGDADRFAGDDQAGIWLGAAIPPPAAVEVIAIAVRLWPFLKYVHLSTDADPSAPDEIHTQIFLGGSTKSATTFLNCAAWAARDFAGLKVGMTEEQLHEYIRARYRS